MPLEVIGAGLGRTGTASLKLALETLGYSRCHHMSEVFGNARQCEFWERASRGDKMDWDEVFDGFKASVDWPSVSYYRELAEYYPNAKVILGVRDPEAWYRSAIETIYPVSYVIPNWVGLLSTSVRNLKKANMRAIWQGTFDGRFEDKDYTVQVFRDHVEEVQRIIPPERLLLHEAKSGWEPLCTFLGKPIPDTPYPRANESAKAKRVLMVAAWISRIPWILAILIAIAVAIWLI